MLLDLIDDTGFQSDRALSPSNSLEMGEDWNAFVVTFTPPKTTKVARKRPLVINLARNELALTTFDCVNDFAG